MLCSFSLQLIFCSEQPFYGNYSTLDSHTNTVISQAFAYWSRWRRKPWQGLLSETFFFMIILTLCYRENYEGEIDNKWQILCALQGFPLEYLWLSRKPNDCIEKVTFSVGEKWMEAVDKCRKIHIDFHPSEKFSAKRYSKTSELKIVSFWSDLILLL